VHGLHLNIGSVLGTVFYDPTYPPTHASKPEQRVLLAAAASAYMKKSRKAFLYLQCLLTRLGRREEIPAPCQLPASGAGPALAERLGSGQEGLPPKRLRAGGFPGVPLVAAERAETLGALGR